MNIFWALAGVIIFSIAGLWSTGFWDKFSKAELRAEKIKYGIRLISILILLMLPGAFLSTYFWNDYFHQLDRDAQKQEMIRILAAELVFNREIYKDNKFRDPNNDNLSTFVIYPRFQKVGLESAISCGLFISEGDRELFSSIYIMYEWISNINGRLDLSESAMLFNLQPDNVALWRKKIRDGKTLSSLGPILMKTATLLIRKYGIKEDDVFFTEIE